jgi:hypothetical protein
MQVEMEALVGQLERLRGDVDEAEAAVEGAQAREKELRAAVAAAEARVAALRAEADVTRAAVVAPAAAGVLSRLRRHAKAQVQHCITLWPLLRLPAASAPTPGICDTPACPSALCVCCLGILQGPHISMAHQHACKLVHRCSVPVVDASPEHHTIRAVGCTCGMCLDDLSYGE